MPSSRADGGFFFLSASRASSWPRLAAARPMSAKVAPAEPPVVPVSQPIQREVTDYAEFTGQTKGSSRMTSSPRSPATWSRCRSRKERRSRRETCCSKLIPGSTRPSSTRLRARSISTRPRSSWPGQPSPATGPSTPPRPARSARSNSIRSRLWSTRPWPGSMPPRGRMELYRLNYEFTKVVSPIDGQTSRYYMTLGNLVNQDQTLLTTVVSVDPMYVYFEVDEPTLARYLTAIGQTKGRSSQERRPNARLHGAARRGSASRTRGPSTSSTTRATPRRAPPWCELSSRTRCPREAAGCSHPACSRESACRSAYPTGRFWSVIGPSRRTRG